MLSYLLSFVRNSELLLWSPRDLTDAFTDTPMMTGQPLTLPITNKNTRQFTRFFLAGAAECELDKQGRILLPAVLREFAGLEKDVVLVGSASKIEIWSKERFDESNAEYEGNMDEVAANMENLGFSI